MDQSMYLVLFSNPQGYQETKKSEVYYIMCIINRLLCSMLLADYDSYPGLYSLLAHKSTEIGSTLLNLHLTKGLICL